MSDYFILGKKHTAMPEKKTKFLSVMAFLVMMVCIAFVTPGAAYTTDNIIDDLNDYASDACPPYANYVWVDTDGINNGPAYGIYDTIVVFQTITGDAGPDPFGYFFTADKTHCGGGFLDRGRIVVHFVDMLDPGFVEANPATWTYKSVPHVQLTASHDGTVASGRPYEDSYLMVQAYQELYQTNPIAGTIEPDPGVGLPRDFEFYDPAGIKELYVSTDWAENSISIFRILTGEPLNTVSVKAPNGGENWLKGSSHTIQWSYTGTVGTMFKIELLKAGTLDSLIADVTNTGSPDQSYDWTIPASLTLGSDYTVRITGSDPMGYSDISDAAFSISDTVPLAIIIDTPSGGESWAMDSMHTLKWSPSGDVGATFKIELLKGGAVVSTIAEVANTGAATQTYDWAVPATLAKGSDYQIRITGSGPDAFATTSDMFAIKESGTSEIPEFGAPFIPAAMVISMIGMVFLLRMNKKDN